MIVKFRFSSDHKKQQILFFPHYSSAPSLLLALLSIHDCWLLHISSLPHPTPSLRRRGHWSNIVSGLLSLVAVLPPCFLFYYYFGGVPSTFFVLWLVDCWLYHAWSSAPCCFFYLGACTLLCYYFGGIPFTLFHPVACWLLNIPCLSLAPWGSFHLGHYTILYYYFFGSLRSFHPYFIVGSILHYHYFGGLTSTLVLVAAYSNFVGCLCGVPSAFQFLVGSLLYYCCCGWCSIHSSLYAPVWSRLVLIVSFVFLPLASHFRMTLECKNISSTLMLRGQHWKS